MLDMKVKEHSNIKIYSRYLRRDINNQG